MKAIIAEPGWGNLIIEDDETGEISLQCLGGGFAMYWHRIVLTADETTAFRSGSLDVDNLVWEMNHGTERMAPRIVAPYENAGLGRRA
jgi:hypothetical protein